MVRAAEKTFDAKALESRIARYWQDTDAFQQTRKARAHGEPWYFLDGPPYATGHIHIGTARNKILKDMHVRHMRMRGRHVRDQPGYDMHGLPIEVKVEKELGIENKQQIEERGIDKFVDACRHFAVEHLKMMNEEFRELGVWLDWEHPYMTITNDYIEGAWWAIEKAHERGLLFEGERVISWCWRCETALAAGELEHEERTDPSVYVKFPIVGHEGESLVIWTTTPWTLPANVAITAHPSFTYARVRVSKDGRSEVLVLLAEQAERLLTLFGYERWEILETAQGNAGEWTLGRHGLAGVRYHHPFADVMEFHRDPRYDRQGSVLLGEHVTADRTGLVHTATGHGVEDFEVGRQYHIPAFSPVGEDGRYTEEAGAFAGLHVKLPAKAPTPQAGGGHVPVSEADNAVLTKLAGADLLVGKVRGEKHSYAHCWRCKNPIIFRATSQWFIDVPKIKDKMIAETKRVQWTPDWAGSHRQLDWVEGAREWCISRQRYWGIPLPIWKCAHCKHVSVIGSRKELHHVSDLKHDTDLHRPWIDKVRVVCPTRGCGGVMKRVPDVLDVWFDSAVASWASLGYPAHKHELEKWFPAQWIVEGLDQTRGWFYSQLAAGVAAMDRVPYERVVMHGWVNDAQGRPMSKSLGNIVAPKDVIDQFGADAFRMGLTGGAAPWEDVSFGTENVRNAQRTLNILWNVHVFATQYMEADGFDGKAPPEASFRPEDKWLLSRLQTTVADATRFFEASEFHKMIREVERFILEDLSRWYVRLVRERVWDEAESEAKRAAYHALYQSLMTTAKLLAPVAPYAADAVYQDLTGGRGKTTVHMEDWPVADAAQTDYDLERDMGSVRAVVEAAAYARQKENMKLRWPVAKLVIATDDSDVRSAIARFRPILLEQANAKEIELVGGEWSKLDLVAVPNKQFIGKTYRAEGPKVLKAIANLDQTQLRYLRGAFKAGEKAPLDADGMRVDLTPEMLSFETKLPAHTTGADFPGGSVYVDTEVSKELEAEGAARDLTRRIQEMRKVLGLEMTATIRVDVQAQPEFTALVAPHLGGIGVDTRAAGGIKFVTAAKGALVKEWDLEGTVVTIGVSPASAAKHAVAPAPASSTPAKAAKPANAKAAPAKPAKKPAAKKAPKAKASVKRIVKAAKKAVKVVAKKVAPKKKAKPAKKKAPAKRAPSPKGKAKKGKR